MSHRGFSDVGLSTLDLDKIRNFYESILGFKPVVADTIKIEEGGRIRHIFFAAVCGGIGGSRWNVGELMIVAGEDPETEANSVPVHGERRGHGVPR